ncbi:MAG: helix-turn-helix domain-containing protein [Muribaculaceae bacterium]|nr:helix-turn-helix domain-containing protein [Ruminococcus flavefaciens]MCM1297680.1 helix-turn-helix domain-containing protein [Muribaculaceae bacterium]
MEVEKELNVNTLFADYPDVVTVEQLKEMLQIGHVLAYRLVKSGEIKSKKIGREYKIPKTNVIKYISEEL